jgi:hypothetical protein
VQMANNTADYLMAERDRLRKSLEKPLDTETAIE